MSCLTSAKQSKNISNCGGGVIWSNWWVFSCSHLLTFENQLSELEITRLLRLLNFYYDHK